MSWPWLRPEPSDYRQMICHSHRTVGKRNRLRVAAKHQPAPDTAAWLATHEPTRCPDGYAWGDTFADEDTDDLAEIARRHNLP